MVKKVNISSMVDIRYALEQQFGESLKELGFKEDHFYSNVHLILGYIGSIPCIVASIYSFLNPFETTIWYVVPTVILYYVCSYTALYVQKSMKRDTVYVGQRKDKLGQHPPQNLRIDMISNKYSDQCEFKFYRTKGERMDLGASYKKSVGQFFDSKGVMSLAAIQDFLKHAIEQDLKLE